MADPAIFVTSGTDGTSEARARDLARRYRREFVDLKNYHIQHELFRTVPVDLMFRYNFVPLEEHGEELMMRSPIPAG